jgi:hypothetical protein
MDRSPNPYRPSLTWPVIALLAAEVTVATLAVVTISVDRDVNRGVYTGEIADGGPVYRLPAIEVVVDRKTELARIEREERRERQARERGARPTA